MQSIAIIGGGIIGLSIGWRLAREKFSVQIFDKGNAGKQASWAAAGMLAPYSEAVFTHRGLFQIGMESLKLYPSFLSELQQDSDITLPQESEGTLYVSLNRDDHEWLQRQYIFKKEKGMPVFWLAGEEARQKEPLLSPKVNAGLWIPSEKQIDNHLLIQSLIKAFLAQGGTLTEKTKITKLWRIQENKNLKMQTENGQIYEADIVIHATGAWANHLSEGNRVHPIKGQVLNLKMSHDLSLKYMIRTQRIYLAPKQSTFVRVGATSEDHGFNQDITAGATLELLEGAREVVPVVFDYKVDEIVVGLRPMTANHMPIIEASPIKGIYSAIGHGRAGILLAPYTAYVIKKLIKDCYESSI